MRTEDGGERKKKEEEGRERCELDARPSPRDICRLSTPRRLIGGLRDEEGNFSHHPEIPTLVVLPLLPIEYLPERLEDGGRLDVGIRCFEPGREESHKTRGGSVRQSERCLKRAEIVHLEVLEG